MLIESCIMFRTRALCVLLLLCPNHGVKLSRGAADLPVSVLLRTEACCSTSTVREAMALTVSASSSDWPWAPLGPSNSEWPLVWDKLWRQGQCLPSGKERERYTWAEDRYMLELLFITGDMHCVWVCVCVFLTLDLYYSLQWGPSFWTWLLLRPLKHRVTLRETEGVCYHSCVKSTSVFRLKHIQQIHHWRL